MDLYGSLSGANFTNFMISVDYCNQTLLSKRYPGKNKTCYSKAIIDPIISSSVLSLYIMNGYFDPNEFNESPIKPYIHYRSYNMAPGKATY
jgi:hypothetical protein